MIEFKNIPVDDAAAERLVNLLGKIGVYPEDAQFLVDEALSISIYFLRSLDDKVKEASSDKLDRTVIQQLVFMQCIQSMQQAMKINAIKNLIEMFDD